MNTITLNVVVTPYHIAMSTIESESICECSMFNLRCLRVRYKRTVRNVVARMIIKLKKEGIDNIIIMISGPESIKNFTLNRFEKSGLKVLNVIDLNSPTNK